MQFVAMMYEFYKLFITFVTLSSLSQVNSTNNGVIDDVIREQLQVDKRDQAFFVVNVENAINRYRLYRRYLPRVEPHYAIKCNPLPLLIELYAAMGLGFDCASKNEIKMVTNIDYTTKAIVYSNTEKHPSHMEFARDNGVDLTTFDNVAELEKVAQVDPKIRLLVRIGVDNPNATFIFGKKFGAHLNRVPFLLKRAREMNLNVVGVHFHIGSNVTDPHAYKKAIADSRRVFDWGQEQGFQMKILDIGGGFPGEERLNREFIEEALEITNDLNNLFPSTDERFRNLRILAEPGRFFAASIFTLVTTVLGRRIENTRERWYYLNDGVSQSFNSGKVSYSEFHSRRNWRLDNKTINASFWPDLYGNNGTRPSYRTILYGQTCNTHDAIMENIMFPDTNVGEQIKFLEMGAYSAIMGGVFNGYELPYYVYYVSADAYNYLSKLERWPRIKRLLDSEQYVYGEKSISHVFRHARVVRSV